METHFTLVTLSHLLERSPSYTLTIFGGVRSTKTGSEYDIPRRPAILEATAVTCTNVLWTRVTLALYAKLFSPTL